MKNFHDNLIEVKTSKIKFKELLKSIISFLKEEIEEISKELKSKKEIDDVLKKKRLFGLYLGQKN